MLGEQDLGTAVEAALLCLGGPLAILVCLAGMLRYIGTHWPRGGRGGYPWV